MIFMLFMMINKNQKQLIIIECNCKGNDYDDDDYREKLPVRGKERE